MNKKLLFWLSGRPRTWDDLQALQNQIGTVESQFHGYGAFIFTGCAVTPNGANYNIAAGLVMIDNKLMLFDGASNIALPAKLIAGAPVESDSRNDAAGNPHNAFTETKAIVGVPAAQAQFIEITSAGGRTFWDVVRAGIDLDGFLNAFANKVQPLWQPLPVITNNGAGAAGSLEYHKDTMGFVRIRGHVTCTKTYVSGSNGGQVANHEIVATLPVGARPATNLNGVFSYWAEASLYSNTPGKMVRFDCHIDTNGGIKIDHVEESALEFLFNNGMGFYAGL